MPPLKHDKTPQQALSALMRLCSRAEKCSEDASRLLVRWGIAPADRQEILRRLVADRFIDDRRYAESFVREKRRLSNWGIHKIRTALAAKRLPPETIAEVLAPIDSEEERSRLKEQLRRKNRTVRASSPFDRKAKLMRYGISLGYEYEQVTDTVNLLMKDYDE